MPIYKVPPPMYPPPKYFPTQLRPLPFPPAVATDMSVSKVPNPVRPKPHQSKFQWPPPPRKDSTSPARRHSIASTGCCAYNERISPTFTFQTPTHFQTLPLYPAEQPSPGRTSDIRRPSEQSPVFSPTQHPRSSQEWPALPSYEANSSISPPRRHSTSSSIYQDLSSPTSVFELPEPSPPVFSPTQQPTPFQGSPAPPNLEAKSSISPIRRHSTASTIYQEPWSPTPEYKSLVAPQRHHSTTSTIYQEPWSPTPEYKSLVSSQRHHSTTSTIYQEPWSPTLPFELPILPSSKDPRAPGLLQKDRPKQLAGTATSASNADFSDTKNPFAKPGPSDDFVRSLNVVGLMSNTFKSFLQDVDVSMVLFYNPCDAKSKLARNGIKQAAEITKRPNHAYAAVDCTTENELCSKLDVTAFPTMKLFARGITVNTFGQDAFLNAQDMKLFVESTPAVRSKSKRSKTCKVQ